MTAIARARPAGTRSKPYGVAPPNAWTRPSLVRTYAPAFGLAASATTVGRAEDQHVPADAAITVVVHVRDDAVRRGDLARELGAHDVVALVGAAARARRAEVAAVVDGPVDREPDRMHDAGRVRG